MGKKYLNTKEGSIEQSILDVWQEAAEMRDEGMDGRTKEYRSHRGKLESNRVKRENKKNSVKIEQPETQDGAGEHAFEVGTNRYAEYTQLVTPGQTEEGIIGNIAKAGAKSVGRKIKSTAKSAYGKTIVGKAQSTVAKKVKKVGSGIKRVKQAAKTGEEVELEREENMTENSNLVDTIKNLWIEAASSAVDPKDREELDLDAKNSAKKMKRAKEPAPNVSEEVELDEKIEYVEYKFKNKRDAEFAKRYLGVQQGISFEFNDDAISLGELGVDAGTQDMTKHHNVVMKRWNPEIEVEEGSKPGQRAEASGDKEAYKKFFNAALKKFKVSSPAELKGDDKKKFFDYIDKGWEGDNEKAEAAMSQVREFKIQSMKAALAQIWGMEEGKNPFKTENDKKEDDEKNGNTMTGKKKAVVDINPDQSYH